MCDTPFGNSSGGQTLAHVAVQVAFPAGSMLNRYKVRPALVVKTVPSLGTETALIVNVFPEPSAEAGAEEASAPTAKVTATSVPALPIKTAFVLLVIAAALLERKRPVRNATF